MANTIKAKRVKMTATTSTGAVFTSIVTMEKGGDEGETLGEIQSNFLWELFEFEMEDIEDIVLPAASPVNIYEDVVQVK